MRNIWKTFIIAVLVIVPQLTHAYDLEGHVREFKLDNGMRWLFVKRGEAPVFSGVVMIRVGGVDEEAGKTGLAHMFEHMAFKGSSRLGTKDWKAEEPILKEIEETGEKLTKLETTSPGSKKEIAKLRKRMGMLRAKASQYQIRNELWEVLMRNGAADLNAFTSKDITTYFASLPVSRMELWARVTADMVLNPAFREFYLEREVVSEERRTAVENSPGGVLAESVLGVAYDGGPYSWSTIGLEDDIDGLTIDDARSFHRKHYIPRNMVGVIVGDVSYSKVKGVVKRAFGRYPDGREPAEPTLKGVNRGGVKKRIKFNAEPAMAIGFHKPTLPDRKEYVFDVITSLLCDGRSSWLEKRLIYDDGLVKDVYCSSGFPGSRLDNLFLIWVEPMMGKSMKRIVAAIDDEIGRLKRKEVSAADLERVRKQVTSSIMFSLDSNDKLAEALARFETIFGDWRILADYPANIEKVSADDVKEVAKEYLVPSNRVIVERTR